MRSWSRPTRWTRRRSSSWCGTTCGGSAAGGGPGLDRMAELFLELGVEPAPPRPRSERPPSTARGARAGRDCPLGSGRPRALLPAPRSRMIGRGADLEEVAALLRPHRIVTITGPGGAGKSTLALELARDFQPVAARRLTRGDPRRARTGARRCGGHSGGRRGGWCPGRRRGPRPHARSQPRTPAGAAGAGQLRAPPRCQCSARGRHPRCGPTCTRSGDQPRSAAGRRRGRAPDRVTRPGSPRALRRTSDRRRGTGDRRDATTHASSSCANGWTGFPWRSSWPRPSCGT